MVQTLAVPERHVSACRRGWRRLRPLLVILLLLAATWALAPQALDAPRLWGYVRRAAPVPLALAFLCQVPRYLGAGFLMSLCTRHLERPAPMILSGEVALASAAASRILPIGGAGGVAVRFAYLKRCGMSQAAIGGYLLLQNVLGSSVLVAIFLVALLQHGLGGNEGIRLGVVVPSLASVGVLGGALALLARRPRAADRAAKALGGGVDRLLRRFGRSPSFEVRLLEAMASLRHSLAAGVGGKWGLIEGLFYSSWTVAGDMASLHLAAVALHFGAAPAQTVVAYTVSSFAASAVAMPAGLGVTEGTMAAAYAGLGLPLGAAVSVVLVFRALSFWLPILLGLAAAWHLRLRGAL